MSGVNPKNEFGRRKPNLALIPPSAYIYMATALMDGAVKYGKFNWRKTGVSMEVYLAPMVRHFGAFLDGQDFDPKTKVHHLAYVMANCAIILDATSIGNMVDDRPLPGKAAELIERFMKQGNLMPEDKSSSLVPETPSRVAALEDALMKLAVSNVGMYSTRCKLCETESHYADAFVPRHHIHLSECLLSEVKREG